MEEISAIQPNQKYIALSYKDKENKCNQNVPKITLRKQFAHLPSKITAIIE